MTNHVKDCRRSVRTGQLYQKPKQQRQFYSWRRVALFTSIFPVTLHPTLQHNTDTTRLSTHGLPLKQGKTTREYSTFSLVEYQLYTKKGNVVSVGGGRRTTAGCGIAKLQGARQATRNRWTPSRISPREGGGGHAIENQHE